MIFFTIRIVLLVLCSLGVFLFLKKRYTKVRLWLSIIICAVVLLILYIFPPEMMIEFISAESAYRYCRTGRIVDSVEGESSTFLCTEEAWKDSYSYCVIPKNKNGYKIPGGYSNNSIERLISQNGLSASIKRNRESKDLYLSGLCVLNAPIDSIADNCGNEIRYLLIDNGSGYYKYFIYSFVPELADDYSIIVLTKD